MLCLVSLFKYNHLSLHVIEKMVNFFRFFLRELLTELLGYFFEL